MGPQEGDCRRPINGLFRRRSLVNDIGCPLGAQPGQPRGDLFPGRETTSWQKKKASGAGKANAASDPRLGDAEGLAHALCLETSLLPRPPAKHRFAKDWQRDAFVTPG